MIEQVSYETLKICLLSLWISFLVLYPLFTAFLKDKKQRWGRFWIVWFATAVSTGLILFLLINSPDKFSEFVSGAYKWLSNLFNFTK